MKKAALDLAAAADIVIYCFGLDELSESEGLDRTHMRIPQNQIDLLQAIVQVNENVVGLLSAGGINRNAVALLLQGDFAWISEWTGRCRRNAEYYYRKGKSVWTAERKLSASSRGYTGIPPFSEYTAECGVQGRDLYRLSLL